MKPAVLFDLGNTLAAYYHPDEFQPILEAAVHALSRELRALGLSDVSFDAALASAIVENKEAPDFSFTPIAERLERIFRISLADDSVLAERLSAFFLRPIFELGRVYDDSLPTLARLRRAGHPVAIVSNAPWGSPPRLWRQELERLGLAPAVDRVVLCGDVGWRKPAAEIFEFAARSLGRKPKECVFVGDDPRWDISGSEAVGMRPVLIDRDGKNQTYKGERIEDLGELLRIIWPGGR